MAFHSTRGTHFAAVFRAIDFGPYEEELEVVFETESAQYQMSVYEFNHMVDAIKRFHSDGLIPGPLHWIVWGDDDGEDYERSVVPEIPQLISALRVFQENYEASVSELEKQLIADKADWRSDLSPEDLQDLITFLEEAHTRRQIVSIYSFQE